MADFTQAEYEKLSAELSVEEAKSVSRRIAEEAAPRIAEEIARDEARKTTLNWLNLTSNSRINLQDDNRQLHDMMNLLSDTEGDDGRRT